VLLKLSFERVLASLLFVCSSKKEKEKLKKLLMVSKLITEIYSRDLFKYYLDRLDTNKNNSTRNT